MDEKYGENENYHSLTTILPYFKPYLFRTLLALLLAIPIGSLDAVIALSLKPYMDIVMLNKQMQSPLYIPFLIIIFTTIQGTLNYLATYMNDWVGGKVTNDLKIDLYKKLMHQSSSFFDKQTLLLYFSISKPFFFIILSPSRLYATYKEKSRVSPALPK